MHKRVALLRWLLSALALSASAVPSMAQTLSSPTLDPAPIASDALSKLDPLLQNVVLTPGSSQVIVCAHDLASMSAVDLLIAQTGGALGRSLPVVEGRVAVIPNPSLLTVASSALVRHIALDRLVIGATERTGAAIGATLVRQELGVDGAGIGVAVIDSGVTAWHDDLAGHDGLGAQRIVQFVDFVADGGLPYDDYGHGTHVAGIIAGNGYDSGGRRSGIAPAAQLMILKVLDGQGRGTISNVIAALQHVISTANQFQIRVVNMSVGAAVSESYQADPLTLAAKRAVERGLTVVAAAGNLGKDSLGRIVYGAITAPGNAPWVLTVGASSHMGTVDRSDDTIAAFSSRGPTAIDRAAKPDLVAPGVGIESLSSPQSLFYTSKSPYLLHGTLPTSFLPYLSLSGTSQAAPVVAGTVALMLQANPALTPNAIKAILQYTAESKGEYDPLTEGAGFLNAAGAVRLARFLASPTASPDPAAPEWSRQLIWGNHRVRAGRLTVDATAWSTDVVWGAAGTPSGDAVTWGVMCSEPDCTQRSTWGAQCSDANCTTVVWGDSAENNVVWGASCGGADCPGTTWSMSDSDTVVWGNSDSDTVVWGNSDGGDTVVWGNSDGGDTVVWGNGGGEDVVWPPCNSPECEPPPDAAEDGHV